MTRSVSEVIAGARVIPVLRIDALEQAVPLAGALIAGGLDVLEVTLRTPVAVDAARAMMDAYPQAKVGLGTVTDRAGLAKAEDLGVAFAVSPGLSPDLADAARQSPLPFLPGVSTVSEAMTARQAGFNHLKLFPAELSGGVKLLQSMAPLFAALQFCPTGGVSPANMGEYLAQPNVFAIGGSWLAPADILARGDWAAITDLARAAVDTARG